MIDTLYSLYKTRPLTLLLGFILLHVVAWTLIPSLLFTNAPLDVIESVAWGQEWQWGYAKHPPLSAWLAELFIIRDHLWSAFLLSQFCIAACFYIMWKLAQEFTSSQNALLSVLLLEGVYYYNYTSPEFNPNVLQLPLWAGISLCFWFCLKHNRLRDWFLLGFIGGLTFLTKYYSAFLFASMFLLLLSTAEGRKMLRQKGPYVALIIFLITVSPHIIWAIEHSFSTISYGLNRSQGTGSFIDHIFYPARFILAQSYALLPALLIAILSINKLLYISRVTDFKTKNISYRFLLFMGLGPFLLTLLVSALFGLKLKSMWGTPLWNFAGLFIVLLISRDAILSLGIFRRFSRWWIAVFLLPLIIVSIQHTVGQMLHKKPSRGQFYGREIAQRLDKEWQARFDTPFKMVGSSLWLGGNITFYSHYRPSLYVDLDRAKSAWASDDLLRKNGGILLWDTGWGEKRYLDWLKRFPEAKIQPPLYFDAKGKKLALGWAIIPPDGKSVKE